MADSFATKYIEASKKVVEILKAETEAGGILENEIEKKHIWWGGITKAKLAKLKSGQRGIFAVPGFADLLADTTGSYETSPDFHVMCAGRFPDLDESLEETMIAGGLVIDVFKKKINQDLDGTLRIIHDPDGGADFTYSPDFAPTGLKPRIAYFQVVEVVFKGEFYVDAF